MCISVHCQMPFQDTKLVSRRARKEISIIFPRKVEKGIVAEQFLFYFFSSVNKIYKSWKFEATNTWFCCWFEDITVYIFLKCVSGNSFKPFFSALSAVVVSAVWQGAWQLLSDASWTQNVTLYQPLIIQIGFPSWQPCRLLTQCSALGNMQKLQQTFVVTFTPWR